MDAFLYRESTDNGNFSLLPQETLIHIFSYLDPVSLARCSEVCRLFRNIAKEPQLYAKVCLKCHFQLATNQMLAYYSDKCNRTTHIDLSWCGSYSGISSDALVSFLSASSVLTHVRLNNVRCVDHSVLKTLVNVCSSKLIELSLANCIQLAGEDFEALVSTSANYPSLRHLNLSRTAIDQNQLVAILKKSKG